jgi:alpha-tubulin suppressor-like RCC1 family protein
MQQFKETTMSKNSRKLIVIAAALSAAFFSVTGFILAREDSVIVAHENKLPFIAAGVNQSFIVDRGGKVYAAGRHTYNLRDLGDDETIRATFASVSSLEGKNITQVVATNNHYQSLALDADGKVYVAGDYVNPDILIVAGFILGRNQPFTPALSLEGKKIVALAVGYGHSSLALGADGKLYANGADKEDMNTFRRVADLRDKKIVAVAASGHLLALDIDGKVYGAGLNDSGQLGLGDNTHRANFVLVSSLEGKKIVAVAAGGVHSFAIDENGKLYATGNNGSGQLGDSKREDHQEVFKPVLSLADKNITQIVAGGSHSLALDSDGKLYAAGSHGEGQLGLGSVEFYYRDEFTLVSSLEGKKIVAIAAGDGHSLAIDELDNIYATGSNRDGKLGVGDTEYRNVFTPVILSDR